MVNAFQRVKINEVEFADKKLQDNSYQAKDGAEIGYGAKGQEVLGQVRGRDFRHERTKRKRLVLSSSASHQFAHYCIGPQSLCRVLLLLLFLNFYYYLIWFTEDFFRI